MNVSIQDYNQKRVFRINPEEPEKIYGTKIHGSTISNDGNFYLVPGKLRLADKTILKAYFLISTADSGELFDYFIFWRDELLSSDDDLIKKFGKKENEMFPFKYHIEYKIENDIHLEEKY